MAGAEWLSLTMLVVLVGGFLTEPLHGVNSAWVPVWRWMGLLR
jgi:hypothetical protein